MRGLLVVLGSGRRYGQKHPLPKMPEHGRKRETKAHTESGEETKEGEEMTKSEVQRYNRIVLRLFAHYQDYLTRRKPRKCKMMKVIRHYSDQYRWEVTENYGEARHD